MDEYEHVIHLILDPQKKKTKEKAKIAKNSLLPLSYIWDGRAFLSKRWSTIGCSLLDISSQEGEAPSNGGKGEWVSGLLSLDWLVRSDLFSHISTLFLFQTRRIGIWPRCDLSLSLVVVELWFYLARNRFTRRRMIKAKSFRHLLSMFSFQNSWSPTLRHYHRKKTWLVDNYFVIVESDQFFWSCSGLEKLPFSIPEVTEPM